jgi:serine/threonine protein kinase
VAGDLRGRGYSDSYSFYSIERVNMAALGPPPSYKLAGAGTYGAVIQPALPNEINGVDTPFPKNVTKVFFKPGELEKALVAITKVPAVMNSISGPNNGHIVQRYSKTYKARNLPPSLLASIRSKTKAPIANESDLQLLRMPYLGLDLYVSKQPKVINVLRNRSIYILLHQIHKLLQQTTSLYKNGYIHADIRETNIVIHPFTGIMTIIDFDWLDTPENIIKRRYAFGFYNNPPECLLYKQWDHIFEKNPDGTYKYDYNPRDIASVANFIDMAKLDTYVTDNENSFRYIYTEMGRLGHTKDDILETMSENIKSFREIYDADTTKEETFTYVLESFDNYSLGKTILNFLIMLYPTILSQPDNNKVIDVLKSINITNNGVPYTDPQFVIMVEALKEAVRIFSSISNFIFYNRPPATNVLAEYEIMLGKFDTAWFASLGVAVGGAGAGAGVVGGGRKRRKTHRKKISTRSKSK